MNSLTLRFRNVLAARPAVHRLNVRFVQHSRESVVERKMNRIRYEKTQKHLWKKKEEEIMPAGVGKKLSRDEGKKLGWRSPGRTTLGRKNVLNGLSGLDLMSVEPQNANPRVLFHNKERLKKSLPQATPRGGRDKTIRQLRAEKEFFIHISNALESHRMPLLNQAIYDLSGGLEIKPIMITKILVNRDFSFMKIFWLPPLSLDFTFEGESLEQLKQVVTGMNGKFRSLVNERFGKSYCPIVETHYDEATVQLRKATEILQRALKEEREENSISGEDQTELGALLTYAMEHEHELDDHQRDRLFRLLDRANHNNLGLPEHVTAKLVELHDEPEEENDLK